MAQTELRPTPLPAEDAAAAPDLSIIVTVFNELERLHAADARVRAVRFKRNFGQHPAMHAGFARARGDIVVTMDGDLQNAPEDIPRLVDAVEAGADVASGRRAARH